MLKKLTLQNITAFSKAELAFSEGLNIIIGENGTGKSHILKAAYSLIAACTKNGLPMVEEPSKSRLQLEISDKLLGVFMPESVGKMVRYKQSESGRISLGFDDPSFDLEVVVPKKSKADIDLAVTPKAFHDKFPVFFPTRELLTIYPNFVSVYDSHYLQFEQTWRDTCVRLGAPLLKGLDQEAAAELLKPLEMAMNGKVELDKSGRFYLRSGKISTEMPLVAEGLRKIAMVATLVANGSLLGNGYLFWDEPESNLNPRLIKLVARTILHLCRNGIQVFVATHSFFLLRELELLGMHEFADVTKHFMSLKTSRSGVQVSQGPSTDEIDPIVTLDEELEQSERYLGAEGKE
ncbi:MAG: AAA family ATPase [Chitinispirillaceae bacterium]